ncbi:hypothetical protein F66182_4534 [Fusarium sp. NRRL 66182]|nr:hypothetical protein F66182_4534 [Fusarium sp. NRRL 66182]
MTKQTPYVDTRESALIPHPVMYHTHTKLTSHSYLSGNFAPIQQTTTLTKCAHSGCIPSELTGGQYVRNGGNPQAIKRVRALAACESRPPTRIQFPSLNTVGWYNGVQAEGESRTSAFSQEQALGGNGMFSFMKEWTTGHPKVDPVSGEMLLYYNTLLPPYVHYSVLPKRSSEGDGVDLVNKPVWYIPRQDDARIWSFSIPPNHYAQEPRFVWRAFSTEEGGTG